MPARPTAQLAERGTPRSSGWAAWLPFPLILGGTMTLAFVLLPAGPLTALLVANTVAVVTVTYAERRWPHAASWNRSHGDVRVDLLHVLISGIGTTQVVRVLCDVALAGIAMWLASTFARPLWPVEWPFVLQLVLALVVAELAQYWLHRWQHEHDTLWRFHSVHHSAPRLYWLNAARFHPLDVGLLYAFGYVPLILLGCPPGVIALFALFDGVFGMLQHANIEMRLGPLNWIFSAAEPHRWHHSRSVAEANTNYGSNLIVWDLVFGTFFLPRDRLAPLTIGIADMPDFPTRYLAHLAAPFRWKDLKRAAAARRAAEGAESCR